VGQDFNIDPMSSVILQPQPNGELWAVDELVLFSSNTAEVCDELERRFWRWKSQVTIFPDPAGAYRQHARGESDIDIFKEKGFLRVDYPKKHPPIADRVNSVNRMLMSASGETRL
ncbi:TPA: terminase, partial [Klebsiella pneumoniae]